jgi:hypothetical protein
VEIAEIASFGNHSNRAVLLLGAVESAVKSMCAVLEKDEFNQYEQTITKLHEKLSDEEFTKYWEEGKKLTLDEAVELALKKEDND